MKKKSSLPDPAHPLRSPLDLGIDPDLEPLFAFMHTTPGPFPSLMETQGYLLDELCHLVAEAVCRALPKELSMKEQEDIAYRVNRGLVLVFVDMVSHYGDDLLEHIPAHWQPPVGDQATANPPRLMQQLYRLTAAFLAIRIHWDLEKPKGRSICKRHFDVVDKAVLHSIYHSLLHQPGHFWNLSKRTRWIIMGNAHRTDRPPLPPVVGA